jgi:UDP-N-acetylmuramyl pentapeptide phosphotransferase/UDP-N-acetylglucosamine-1-phosphate transferase
MDNSTLIALLKVFMTGLISGVIVLRTSPTINFIARTKGLLNAPGERTSHRYQTPNLAGIAIFIGFCISSLLFIQGQIGVFKTIYLASMIIFFIGLKDDIIVLSPWKKLIAQIVVAALIAMMTDLRFNSFFGLFGIWYFSEIASFVITIIFIVGIINAINLIDGIDGLAASIGTLILGSFGLFFFINELYNWSIYCAGMMGALMMFFQYNVFGLRNKTFMGDSGSLLLGLTIAVTAIMFWEANANKTLFLTFDKSAPAITIAILIVPIFDVARVFAYRIIRRISPFSADRNHLHHRLVDIGFTHLQTSLILTAFNAVMIIVAIALTFVLGTIWITVVLFAITIFCTFIVNKFWTKKMIAAEKKIGGG